MAGLAFAAGYFVPVLEVSFILDILVRSSVFTVLFGIIIYFGKLSPDLNNMAAGFFKKLRKKTS